MHCIQCGAPQKTSEDHGRIFLVRHGQTDWNKEGRSQGQADIPLNAEGIAQAEAAAQLLKDKNIDLIISSDLIRTCMTADAIAKATGAPIIYDQKIRERNFGKMEGLHKDEWHPLYPHAFSDYEYRIPEGESFSDLEKRVHAALRAHREAHAHKNIVIVTHGGVVRMIFKLIRGWTHEETMAYPGTPNGYPFEIHVGDACPTCGGDLYEDPAALEELIATRARDPIYKEKK